ncbi:MAG: type II toxin-antitoxin system HicA family toxin [Deltaproteobacteria bacterium]|nr:type II toxin-antitoxin system HicA family toxin [Deltaproteobacteria bacterium]
MSKKIPALKPRRVLRALLKLGFFIQHQTGSHLRLRHPQKPNPITLVRHDRIELYHLITQRMLRQAEISEEQFLDSL